MEADGAYPGKRFTAYAILGDDLVIADSRVAAEYKRILFEFDVEISYSKSLVSNSGAFEWWIAGGQPLDPYVKGRIAERVRQRVKPRDLRIPTDTEGRCTWPDAEVEFMERTVLRGWMNHYLNWVRWYASVALNPSTNLAELFDYPVVEVSWRRRNVDESVVRFGLLWRALDWVIKEYGFPSFILEERK